MRRACVVIVAAVLLVGCLGASGVSSHPAAATASMPNGGSTVTTDDSGPVVVEGWAPPPVAIPRDPGYVESLGPYADVWLNGGVVPFGSEEHMSYLMSCVESAGFEVTPDLVHLGYTVHAGAQEDRFFKVDAACGQAAIDSGLVASRSNPSRESLVVDYRAKLVQYQCLADHGFTPLGPPSEESFLDSGGMWDPFSGVGSAQFSEAEVVCPHNTTVVIQQVLASGRDLPDGP